MLLNWPSQDALKVTFVEEALHYFSHEFPPTRLQNVNKRASQKPAGLKILVYDGHRLLEVFQTNRLYIKNVLTISIVWKFVKFKH